MRYRETRTNPPSRTAPDLNCRSKPTRFADPNSLCNKNAIDIGIRPLRLRPILSLGVRISVAIPTFGDLSLGWKSELAILSFVQSEYWHNEARFVSQSRTTIKPGYIDGWHVTRPSAEESSGKRSFAEFLIMEAPTTAPSIFINHCFTPVNLWRRRVDE